MSKIQELKDRIDIVEEINKHLQLKKVGANWTACCPFHEENTPSFVVSPTKQIFKCYGCGKGGDIIQFYQEKGHTVKEAIEILGGNFAGEIRDSKKAPNKKKRKEVEYTAPLKPTKELPNLHHNTLGAPDLYYTYKTAKGHIATIIRRYNKPGGKKDFRPLSHLSNGKQDLWLSIAIPNNRPIYNLDKITKKPQANIILVEGEKAADAGNKMKLSGVIFTTWPGGSNGVEKTDWSTLTGRSVLIWPDNDAPGKKAACQIGHILENRDADVRYLHPPKDKPKGWDIADQKFTKLELTQFMADHASQLPPLELVPADQNPKKEDPPENPPQKPHEFWTRQYFQFIGVEIQEGSLIFNFYINQLQTVVKYKQHQLNKKITIESLAPAHEWEKAGFESRKGYDTDRVATFLQQRCMEKKISQKTVRAPGAYKDEGRIVFFDGLNIYEKNNVTHWTDFKTKFVYMPGEDPIKFQTEKTLDKTGAKKIFTFIQELKLENEDQAKLLAGWIVLAPFAAVLPWRPHIWLIGESGKGKSWITTHIIKQLMGEICIFANGATTSAGLRREIGASSRPVIIDEMDSDTIRDRERIQGLIQLARVASAEDPGKIFKSNSAGDGLQFEAKNSFCFTSIIDQLDRQADNNRFSLLTLSGQMDKDKFKLLESAWLDFCTPEVVSQLLARTFVNLPVILQNAELIRAHLTERMAAREADQITYLLAAYYSLLHEGEITALEAMDIAERYKNETDQQERAEQLTDSETVLNLILNYPVRIHEIGRSWHPTIRSLIILGSRQGYFSNPLEWTPERAQAELERFGVVAYEGKDHFAIKNDQIEIYRNVLQGSPYGKNYKKLIKRLPGVEASKNQIRHGARAYGFLIPYTYLGEIEEETPPAPEVDPNKRDKELSDLLKKHQNKTGLIDPEDDPNKDPDLPF